MNDPFRIRATLLGHSLDVRGVAVGTTSGGKSYIVSASRDKTAKIWMPNELGGFDQFQTCEGHTNFVSCVTVMPSSSKYPQGLILTGSNDHSVLGFELGKQMHLFRLSGHKGTVCSISFMNEDTIVTGSWDNTAKIWENQSNTATLIGHEAAVWAVAVTVGTNMVITGSADRTIRLWQGENAIQKYVGHKDCVRAIAVLDSEKFASGCNDSTIRIWNISDGVCLAELNGHTNYIYGLSLFPGGAGMASVGEDRTLRIWKGQTCAQTIHLPATSVWCVAVMPNGDVVTGSSDGCVRIFTASTDRYACPEELAQFEEQVAATTIAAAQELGGLKVSEIPGPEALLVEGKQDGVTKMIREGSIVCCYSWSAADQKWTKIGDVVGASGATQNTSGKVLHEGKEYDYVFSVDLDGSKTLKLPYNISEDPWFAAKRFLDKNELNPQFLDQVANFIITNTKGMELGVSNDGNFADPFTGGNRYVPSGSAPPMGNSGPALDPFTGSGAYRSKEARATDPFSSAANGSAEPCFPCRSFLSFHQQPNLEALKTKLIDFMKEMGVSHKINPDMVAFYIDNVSAGTFNEEVQVLTQNFLELPAERVFPVLDLLRMGVTNPVFGLQLNSEIPIVETLVPKYVAAENPVNQQLVLKLLNNLFGSLSQLVVTHRALIVSKLLDNLKKPKNNQIATATLFLNYSIVATDKENPDWSSFESQTEILMAALSVIEVIDEPEAVYRLLVAFGNLIEKNPLTSKLFKSLNGESFVQNYKQNGTLPKIQNCAAQLLQAL